MKHIAYFVFILTFLAGCQDEFTNTETIFPEIPSPSIMVKSSFIGKIIDTDGNPISNTQVALGGEIQFSNELGYFQFDGVQLDRYGSLLTAEKGGYLLGLRRVSVHAGTTNYVELILLSDSPSYNFNSEESATIEDDSGVSLRFTANSIALESGQAYTGNVNVSVKYINPEAENIASLLPGSLQGLSTEGSLTTLKSYSMISVELTDDQGQELQIKNGETVTVEFPVDAELLSNAPSQIPLWSLDEDSGLWLEEGTAELTGNVYIGEVSHFSYWNCDIPEDFVIVEGNVCNNGNGGCESLAFSEIQVLDQLNEVRLVSQTDSEGNFTISIPKESEVTIDFIKVCDSANDKITIGPFTEDQNLGQIEISADIKQVQFDATVTNCDGSTLDEGLILINDLIYIPVVNGSLSETVSVCDESDITAIAFNADFSRGSELTSIRFSENIMSTFNLCDEDVQTEFISVFATNTVTGESFTEIYIDNRYQPCGEIINTEIAEDGTRTVTSDFVSSITSSFLGEEEIDSSSVYISFDHGESCETPSSDIDVALANPVMLLGDAYYELLMYDKNIFFNGLFGEEGNEIIEVDLVSFGQNEGDIIEGTITADEVNPLKYSDVQEGKVVVDPEADLYLVEISFRLIVKE